MDTPLQLFRDHYQHRDRAARAWKASGGRVVGYLCDNVPEELILAAGFLPYRLSGDPMVGGAALERYLQPFAAPFSARNRGVGFSDAMLEMLLEGRFDFLDYLVVPHTRKAIQAYYRELSLAQEAYPDLRLPELYYLDRAYTPFYAAEVFNRDRLLEFKSALETWSGRPIADEMLVEAIEVTNESRALLGRLADLRAGDPPRLSGADALRVIGTSVFMPKREHNDLLASLLDADLGQTRPPGPRLFLGGSPQDHLQVYDVVESTGATIVAEDHCWGNRCAEFPLDRSMDPIEALADRYHRKPACSIEFPMGRVVDRCVARATLANVDGAIFFVLQADGVHIWDTPEEVRALEERGIPCLFLSQQPYWREDPEDLRRKVEDFVAALQPAAVVR